MKIAFDAKKIVRNRTGIGNYSRRVLCALNPDAAIKSMELFAPRNGDKGLIATLPSKSKLVTPPAYLPGTIGFEIWRATQSASTANRHGIDIYHGLSNELPADIMKFKGAKVVTIHDLIFMRLPDLYKPSMRQILEKKTRFACKVADRIIAISDRTRQDLIDIYGVDPNRIEIIYQSIDPIFFNRATQTSATTAVDNKPYILCVGTVERRKNQKVLIEALSMLPSEINLVIIGRRTQYADELLSHARQANVSHRVKILTGVATADLPGWYRNATVACNPSTYEGFGLPVAEAIAQGTPVVAATGSCLEEAGGPAGIYLSPDNAGEWANTIADIINDKALRQRLSAAGLVYADNFRDTTMRDRLLNLYRNLL